MTSTFWVTFSSCWGIFVAVTIIGLSIYREASFSSPKTYIGSDNKRKTNTVGILFLMFDTSSC